MIHEPVLIEEVGEQLEPSRGGLFVDGTIGLAGHARMLLERGATKLIGLDRDLDALAVARERLSALSDRVDLVHADYRDLAGVLDARGVTTVNGVLVDLGVSSMQLDAPGRGFSFRRDEALDMRMDRSTGPTAAEAIASADERTLADVIYRFGEERHSRRIARAIVGARSAGGIETTLRLAEIVRRAIPGRGHSRIDPATRTFQAVRIWVNRELEGLDAFLATAAGRLAPGGRLAVIAFHSLEDRVVKHTFRAMQAESGQTMHVRTRRPIVPTDDEVERNPRARSAKLRVIERVLSEERGGHEA